MIDYHIHTSRCGHATGEMEEYVKKSIDKGLKEIGFSDHFPMDILGFSDDTICSMNFDELTLYLKDVEYLQEKYEESLTIRTGIEMDYHESIEDKLKIYANNNRWDYIIGSVHFLDGYDFSKPGQEAFFKNKSIDDLYVKYFDEIKKLANSGIFDIVAHIDLIKKFGCKPEKLSLQEIYKEMAGVLFDANMAVEINTAGLRHPVKEIYPSASFVNELILKEVPITFGSDAHRPDDVAYEFSRLFDLVNSLGDGKIYGFCKREPFRLSEAERFL